MIQAILFDLGGVVCRFVPEQRMAALRAASGMPAAEIQAQIWGSGFEAECERGLHTTAAIHREVCHRLGMQMSYERFRALWCLAFEPDDSVLEVVDGFRLKVRAALFTNNGPVLLDAMPVLFPSVVNRFDPLLFSCALGAVKPEPAAFAAALARLNRGAGEVLLVDDSPAVIEGARAAGLHTLLFTTAAALRDGLASSLAEQDH